MSRRRRFRRMPIKPTLVKLGSSQVADAGDDDEGGLPSGAVGVLDFVNGVYLYGATAYTIADVVDHPEFLIAGGLQISSGNVSEASAEILGPFKTYLVAGNWTVVLEFVAPSSTQAFNMSGPVSSYLNYQADTHNLSDVVEFSDVFRYAENPGMPDEGVPWCFALTRTNAKLAISTNGSVVAEDTTPASGFGDVDTAWLGGFSHSSNDGDCLIGRMVIYPPLSNGLLAALSVPSVM